MHTENKPMKPKRENKKQFKCLKCDYLATALSKLRRHDMVHTGELPHKCKMCDYASNQAATLKRHVYDMHTENKPKKPRRVNKKQCSECDYADLSGRHLKRHKVTHTGERAHKCNICNYESTQAASVRRHIDSIHNKIKPKREYKRIQCLKCDYGATSASKLKEHNMIHTGEKPHKCNQCGFASLRERDLRRHMVTHFILYPEVIVEVKVEESVE